MFDLSDVTTPHCDFCGRHLSEVRVLYAEGRGTICLGCAREALQMSERKR